ncbi:zinc finger protein 664 isoform X2 [Drosophila innubila]|uniref:zinc finger protein 664 isoform X2 n=1 Tax=Drosophila innubila TaxID=198719 RepID=UPI00148CA4EA|nr:zinc finger protein 664 isoform X2 [Drosophila innubila]
MLKQCLINVDFSRLHAKQQSRPKCGEIFYESDNEYCSFQLVCCLCEMKHFAFDDFSMHIRNVHFDKNGKPRTTTQQTVNTHPEQQLQFINSTSQSVLEGITNNDNEFLSDEAESDEDADIADALDKTALRICAFNEVKPEPAPAKIESAHFECNSQSEDELDADCSTTAGQEFSDAEADDAESDLETQSVFQQRQLKEYNCEYCAGKYTTIKYLNIHLKMSHPHPKGFKCNDCDATFDVDRALESHRRKVHTEFTCKLCDKIYKSSRTLLRHVQGHSGLRQFKCDYDNCGKSFVSQHNLTSHRRVHSTDRNYVCELCGYRSRYRDALIVHRRTHTGEKPFKCDTCARCFASKSLLNEHQAMHSTDRPYKCDKCEATFSRPKALYHHKHLHLGIKKFKCKICGNAYAQAAGLSAHMRNHKSQAVNGIAEGGTTSTTMCPPY